jgi:FkbM family methyltransferase
LKYRPQTTDRWIRDKINQDEYNVQDDLEGASVLDIGAHAGYFSQFCFDNGAVHVVAIEPHPENLSLLAENCPKAVSVPAAVSNSSKILRMDSAWPVWGSLINTGGQKAGKNGDIIVPCLRLDTVISKFGPFDVMKMDCEGAEWDFMIPFEYEIPIVVGEYHEIDGFTFEDLVKSLYKYRMVTFTRFSNVPIGTFKAVLKSVE